MNALLDLARRCRAAGLHVGDDGRMLAPRGVDPALPAEVRADRAAVLLALQAWAESDERQDLLGVDDEAVREGCRLAAMAEALDDAGDERAIEIAVLANAIATSSMVASAVRLGAIAEGVADDAATV